MEKTELRLLSSYYMAASSGSVRIEKGDMLRENNGKTARVAAVYYSEAQNLTFFEIEGSTPSSPSRLAPVSAFRVMEG